jgi:hypothetical protein
MPPPPPTYPGYGAPGYQGPPGYPGYGVGYGGPYPPQAAKNEPLSVWSLVLGIISYVVCPLVAAIPAIITGGRAKKAIDRSGGMKTGRGMAQAGQILGWINVVLSIAGGIIIGIGVSFFVNHPSYTSLNAGDCFNPSSSFSGLVSKVSCARPHREEAVGSFDLNEGPYPGANGITDIAGPRCGELANAYGVAPQPGLQLVWLYPRRDSWDTGTRKVVCSIRNRDGSKRTGSLRAGAGGSALAGAELATGGSARGG